MIATDYRSIRQPLKLTWPEEQRHPQEPEQVFQAGLKHHNIANTAYPISHRQTIWSYRQPNWQYAPLIQNSLQNRAIGLYLHIPFCEARCRYCEYAVVTTTDTTIRQKYVTALQQEIQLYGQLLGKKQIVGLDIGGGTPSILTAEDIASLIQTVNQHLSQKSNYPISIETTPKIAAEQPDKLSVYFQTGIQRISMGLQTTNPDMLRRYGRELNRVDYNARAVWNIRKAGFQRLNLDLMYGFAGQTTEDFLRTIEHALSLAPEYITFYRMRYKGTSIAKEAKKIELAQINEMYNAGYEKMQKNGYIANPGKNTFSRLTTDPGTSAYLTERVIKATPYLGMGLSAQTFTTNLLAYNQGAASKKLKRYLQDIANHQLPIQDLYHLPQGEAMAKMIAVSFYFGQISRDDFYYHFGEELEQRFPSELQFLQKNGLMYCNHEFWQLTKKGSNAINGVIALFYSDRVKSHLLQ